MTAIDDTLLSMLPLAGVARVTFYKRDEITTDLICCDVDSGGMVCTFHEELEGWGKLIEHLQQLPNFDEGWFAVVSQPPFASRMTVAFDRDEKGPSRE